MKSKSTFNFLIRIINIISNLFSDLHKFIANASRKGLNYEQQLDVCIQLMTGVAAIHELRISHNDLKPKNVFISYDLKQISEVSLNIGDFGLATVTIMLYNLLNFFKFFGKIKV